MRVARESRLELQGLAARFVTRALSHLSAALNQAVEEVAHTVAHQTDREHSK